MNSGRMSIGLGATLVFILSLLFVAPAMADSRLGVKGAFGFGGDAEMKIDSGSSDYDGYDDDYDYYGDGNKIKDDFETTLGLGVFADFGVTENFSIGPEARFYFWITEIQDRGDYGRNSLIDIDITPRLRFPVANGKLELYVALSVGLSVNIMNGDYQDDLEKNGVEINTGLGWNISPMGGMNYFVTEKLGLFAELGYVYHQILRPS